jgi:hypothetical protein
MSTIVTRVGKGSPLTWTEVDSNFTNLNTDKLQSGNTAASLTITSATINGGTITGITDLAVADGGTGLSTLTAGYIPFGAGTSAFGSSANLFWDSANNRLGIGTTSPANTLHVEKSINSNDLVYLNNLGTVAADVLRLNTLGLFTGTYILDVQSNSVSHLIVNGAGNVGIGTTSPDANLTVNGAASFAAGTALLPSIARAGDLNTGMFFPAADTIAFAEGGAEAMRIDSSGNVGIGTTSPVSILEAKTTTAPVITAHANSFAATGNGTGFGTYRSVAGRLSGYSWTIAIANEQGGGGASEYQVDAMTFNLRPTATSGSLSEAMRISAAGNVGIGTTSPVGKLDFGSSAGFSGTVGLPSVSIYASGSNRYGLNVSSNSLDISSLSTNGRISFYTGGSTSSITERMRIDSTGNVGIGTNSPVYNLDVQTASGASSIGIKGGTDRGNLNLLTGAADGTGVTVGVLAFFGGASTSGSAEPRLALISSTTEGATANNRGGRITFFTKADNVASLTERMRIHSSGGVSIGNTTDSGAASLNVSGSMSGGYIAHADGTTAMAFGTDNVARVTPTATASYTTTVPAAGAICVLSILTSGATSYTITFSTGFKSTGTLATGTTTARYFNITFVSDGTNLIEMSRTVAIA